MSHSGPHPTTGPRWITARALGLGLSAVIAAGALAWTPGPTTSWDRSAAEGTLWQLLNGARTNNGMAPLQQHGTLVGLARWRSTDMLDRDYFSHTIPGCGCLVYAYYDSNGLDYVWGGENIGWNSGRSDAESPVRVHEQFMGSAGHRANVLDRRFTHGGVGAAAADNREFLGYVQDTRMYTELFMQAPSAAPPPPPPPPPAAPAPPAPTPAPRPPGGGGGAAPTPPPPAAPVVTPVAAPEPEPGPEPKPKVVAVGAPRRPVSAAGIDGIATRVSPAIAVADLRVRHTLDERAAERAAALVVTSPASDASPIAAAPEVVALEVSSPDEPEPGLLESIVGAVMGFLFG